MNNISALLDNSQLSSPGSDAGQTQDEAVKVLASHSKDVVFSAQNVSVNSSTSVMQFPANNYFTHEITRPWSSGCAILVSTKASGQN